MVARPRQVQSSGVGASSVVRASRPVSQTGHCNGSRPVRRVRRVSQVCGGFDGRVGCNIEEGSNARERPVLDAVGKPTVMANALEAVGQKVQEEASQEGCRVESGELLTVVVGTVSPAEGHAVTLTIATRRWFEIAMRWV